MDIIELIGRLHNTLTEELFPHVVHGSPCELKIGCHFTGQGLTVIGPFLGYIAVEDVDRRHYFLGADDGPRRPVAPLQI